MRDLDCTTSTGKSSKRYVSCCIVSVCACGTERVCLDEAQYDHLNKRNSFHLNSPLCPSSPPPSSLLAPFVIILVRVQPHVVQGVLPSAATSEIFFPTHFDTALVTMDWRNRRMNGIFDFHHGVVVLCMPAANESHGSDQCSATRMPTFLFRSLITIQQYYQYIH